MLLATEETVHLSTGWFLEHAWLIPLIPGIGFAVIILIGKRLPFKGSEVGIGTMGAATALAFGAAYQWIQRVNSASSGEGEHALGAVFQNAVRAAEGGEHHAAPYVQPVIESWTWWQSGGLELTIGQHIDGLAVMLLVLVTFISLLVQIFSTEYVRDDRRYTHFFAALTLFSAGMLVMVLAESMLQVILGWEIMGLCSFMLIGHWWEDQYNSRSAMKAFLTVRTGDVGLLVGTAIIYFGADEWARARGSNGFSIQAISGWAASNPEGSALLTWGAIALFIACIGKSGQFPLHTWLPDAMAGPTPVSSLLHSSTMVVAGVFLVARLYPVFFVGLDILDTGVNFIAVIGGITLVIAACLAFVQDDIKKVLAYSTVSQLGYMMLGLGVGAWLPAVFHIFTHAFFKCCLFLCAGAISHSGSHHSFDMKKDMGGLRKHMPITFGAWMLSTAALCGIPFFSGFWSKDEIIDNANNNDYTVFWIVGLVGAAMTAAYMTRATYLTFFGEGRGAAAGEHHEQVGVRPQLVAALGVTDEADDKLGSDPNLHDKLGSDPNLQHDDHGPHEAPRPITGPIIILAFFAVFAGFLNAPGAPFKTHYFQDWVEPGGVEVVDTNFATGEPLHAVPEGEATGHGDGSDSLHAGCGTDAPAEGKVCFAHAPRHAEFKWAKAVPSILLVAFGIGISAWLCLGVFGGRRNPFAGLTKRSALARGVHKFLVNKYYLDHLYENVIVRFVAHPLAKAAYWVNQNIIDGIVDGTGRFGKQSGGWVYRNIDQRVVDGAVNGSGFVAGKSGEALTPVQSGRISQYGALLFAAATVGAIVLILINV